MRRRRARAEHSRLAVDLVVITSSHMSFADRHTVIACSGDRTPSAAVRCWPKLQRSRSVAVCLRKRWLASV